MQNVFPSSEIRFSILFYSILLYYLLFPLKQRRFKDLFKDLKVLLLLCNPTGVVRFNRDFYFVIFRRV